MSSDILEKVKQLPFEKQQEVEDFIEFLLSKYKEKDIVSSESLAERRLRNMGWAKGQVWMADNFNDTPDDFKDYI